ncbi:MAG: DUF1499 domain-containing protein [Pseudomonadota bacterium]
MKAWPNFATLAALVALVFFVLVIYGYNWGWWDLGVLFTWVHRMPIALGFASLLAAASAGAYMFRRSIPGLVGALAIAIACAGMAYLPIWMRGEASKVPPIHDITTDTEEPPAFVAIAPLRADAPNPAEYDREQTAQQLEAFPQLQSLVLSVPMDEAFAIALGAVKAEGLKVVAAEEAEGRIEAYATVPMFGFVDDVVIRLRSAEEGTEIDIRSKSRVGRSDLGFNARRIESLLDRMEAEAS